MHLSMLSRREGGGGSGGDGDFDKAFMPEGMAFDFKDSPQCHIALGGLAW